MKKIDQEYLLNYFEHDHQLFYNFLRMFASSIKKDLDLFAEALASSNYKLTATVAHRMKTSFNYVGAIELGRLFGSIEKQAVNQFEIPEIQTKLKQILYDTNELIEEAKFICSHEVSK